MDPKGFFMTKPHQTPAIIGSDHREARGHPQTTRRLWSWAHARKAATSTAGSPEEWCAVGPWEVTSFSSGPWKSLQVFRDELQVKNRG